MRCLTYARVSTEKQADKELSIPAQQKAMREYAQRQGWTIEQEFIEPGVSGRTAERPVLQKLLGRCRTSPKVEVVLVHKIDRLARNVFDHATIRGLLKQREIRLASVVENVDDTITGQLVENIMASIAEFYSANLGEEVKKGMRMMIERGEWPHQPIRGYKISRDSNNRPKSVIDAEVGPLILRAFELYAQGNVSIREVGEELFTRGVTTAAGKPLPLSYVRGMLENPFYAGRIRWHGAEYPGNHEALISQELFAKVQRTLRRRLKNPGERGRMKFLMRGIARCYECGYRVTAERKKDWAYYRCIQNAHGRCYSAYSNVNKSEAALLKLYRTFKLPPRFREGVLQQVDLIASQRDGMARKEAVALRRRRGLLLSKEIKLTEAFAQGDASLESYRPLLRKARLDITEVDEALARIGSAPSDLRLRVEKMLTLADTLADLHSRLELRRQQQLLALVFKSIVLNRGAIVEYKLNPPFDSFFEKSDQAGLSGNPDDTSDPEPQASTSAIKLLFEFDYSVLEALLA